MASEIKTTDEIIWRRLQEPMNLFGTNYDGHWWWAVIIPLLVIGVFFVCWMYLKDHRRIGWYWAVPLGLMRIAVYGLLAVMFLLPARQTWETSERRSRVIVIVDVTDSMTLENADGGSPGSPTPPRLQKITDYLADESNPFLSGLLAKNPVFVYRFGSKLDEESQAFEAAPVANDSKKTEARPLLNQSGSGSVAGRSEQDYLPKWAKEDWYGFATYDFKAWLLRGLSEEGRAKMRKNPDFGEKTGSHTWAQEWYAKDVTITIPDGSSYKPDERLSAADAEVLKSNRDKLLARIKTAASITTATNVPDSLLSAINRESGNMVEGIVVFSDGRSNLGADSTMTQVRVRAKAERIPVFTVYIGEDKKEDAESMRITDLQTPDQTPPDEPFKIVIEVDGEGLAGKTAKVTLRLTPPDMSPPLEMEKEVTFNPGEPPHAQAEFLIDPEKVDAIYKSAASKGKDLLEGEWTANATADHQSRGRNGQLKKLSVKAEERKFKIQTKPLQTLIVASAGNRDFQFLFNQLIRDKADISLYLQNDAGAAGNASLLDDPQRLLKSFPTRIQLGEDAQEQPAERWYNLARYDLIIAFDPDWTLLTDDQVKLLQTWVDLNAGGFLLVAGPLNVKKITYAENQTKFGPLLEVLPVVPGDFDLKSLSRDTKIPHVLNFPGVDPTTDFLRLDDTKMDDPIAGWDLFFYGREKPPEGAKIIRGFYNYYPVKDVKAGAKIICRYDDGPQARDNTFDKKDPPFFVTYKYGQGISAFLGSGEMWRLRQYKDEYYERFWAKMGRHLTAGVRKKQSRRGRLLMSSTVNSGGYIRPRAELLDGSLSPLPPTAEPKFVLKPIELDQYPREVTEAAKRKGDEGVDAEAFERAKDQYHQKLMGKMEWKMTAAKGNEALGPGWFQAQVQAIPEKYPPGLWVIEVPIPNSSEVLRAKFVIRRTNPELDILKPDIESLAKMSEEFSEVEKRLSGNPEALEKLKKGAYSGKEGKRLAFSFTNSDAVGAIPACMDTQVHPQSNKGQSEDLWDRGPELPRGLTNWFDSKKPFRIAWLMLICIGLLSLEWLTRKLLKLA